MSNNPLRNRIIALTGQISMTVAQSLFSRKETILNKTVKSVVGVGVTLFHRKAGHMQDDMIEEDIGFSAEELDAYQFPDRNK